MIKNLFKASFEQSQQIQGKYKAYIKNLYKEMSVLNIFIITFLGVFFIGTIFYGVSIAMPSGFLNSEQGNTQVANDLNMILAAKISQPLIIVSKITFFLWGIVWASLVVIRFLPLWNVRIFSFMGSIVLFQASLLPFFAFFPMLVGLSIVGSGIPGFVFQLTIIFLFFIRSMKSMTNDLSRTLYGGKTKNLPKQKNTKLLFLVFVILIVNSLFPKIGFVTNVFDIFGIIYGWLFILFGVGTIALIRYAVFKNFLCAYYFTKYSDQYRELWQLTDEQWYGKGKAKRMARKKARKDRKSKGV